MFIIKQTIKGYNQSITTLIKGDLKALNDHFKRHTASQSRSIDTLVSKLNKVGNFENVTDKKLSKVESQSIRMIKGV